MHKQKILITGAHGFLGKAVCSRLEQEESYTLHKLKGRAVCDLKDRQQVDKVLNTFQPTMVIHLAARVGGLGANKENPGLFIYENLAMGMTLIEACREYGNLNKFIMVGTVCSYPKFTPVPFKEEDLWNGYPEETNAPYGIAKKTLTELLIAYNQQYDFNCTNLVPVNMYGPNDHFDPKISHVIPALILKIDRAIALDSDKIELWGTGQASREFLYIDDCANAIARSLVSDCSPDPINIGTGQETKIKDLAETLKDIMGYQGDIVFNSDFPDGQPRRCLNIDKANKELGFQATTSLRDGLTETVKWYYDNKNKEQFYDHFCNIQ